MPAQSCLPSNALGWAVLLDMQEGLDVSAYPVTSQVLSNTLFLKWTGFLNSVFLPFPAAVNGRDPNLQWLEFLSARFPDRFSLIKMSTEVTFKSYMQPYKYPTQL